MSKNLQQMYMGQDSVQNWLDTTGLAEGYLSHRWAYYVLIDETDWTVLSAQKINVDEIGNYFLADMPTVTPEQRRYRSYLPRLLFCL